MRTKAELLTELDVMLKDALAAQTKGASQPRLTRALSTADGYMKALIDAGIATHEELLARVAAVRVSSGGPALLETPARAEIAA